MTLRLPIVALALAFSVSAAEYSSRTWRIEDGLPQNRIQSLAQTPDGYLWVGTSGGLVRFDGARFVVFDRSNTPALHDDSIDVLLTAADGSLWIGTEGGGVTHKQGASMRSFSTAEGLTNGFVRAITQDSGGRLWVGTDRGLFRLDNGRFSRLDGRGHAPILAVRTIFQDKAGVIWVTTTFGVFQISGDSMMPLTAFAAELYDTNSITQTADGALLFVSDAGIRRLQAGELTSDALSDTKPRRVAQDHEGTLWIGTAGKGLLRIQGGLVQTFHSPDPLPDESILSLAEDREHNIWVGTQDGLLRMKEKVVRTITTKDGLADDNIMSVYCDPSATVWAAVSSGVLYRMSGEKPIPLTLPVAFRPRSLYVAPDKTMWLGSTGQGLLRVDRTGATSLLSMSNGLRSNGIRDIRQDRSGRVWIATGSGLSRFDNGSIRTFYLEQGLAYGGTRVLAEDVNGDLLVGTDGGMNRVRGDHFLPDPVLRQLGNMRVWAIRVDPTGVLWLGTRGDGLVRVQGTKITRYTTADGLLSNAIYNVVDDGDGRLWMSSAAGVFSVRRSELDALANGRAGPLPVIPYDTDDGMLSSQMNGGIQGAGCISPQGELWFPSVKGIVRIDPRHTRFTPPSPVLIESLSIDDRPVPTDGRIKVPAGSNRLQIDFTSPSPAATDKVSFRYRLEGFDEVWVPALKRRSVWFTNLTPRHYVFRVQARDVARPEHFSEAALEFEMLPHFYQTGVFYALFAVATALLIYAVFHFYARQTRASFELVLAERTRLAREMHDTVIQGCLGVSTLLEAIRSMPQEASAKSKELVDRAASQIRITVNEAREAVWDLRHSSMEQGLTGSLADFVQQVSASEGIPVTFEVSGNPAPVNDNATRNLLLLAREAVRNAVMHAQAQRIAVSVHFDAMHVRVRVSDDGRGFDPGARVQEGHYGVVGMRERVQQCGGTFQLESTPGQGTTVVANLPLI